MAVIFQVEDGTGLTDSNSYVSIADMKQYWDNMGYDYSALTTDEMVQVLLIKHTRIIEGTYGAKYPGSRNSSEQALGWPRTGAKYLDGYTIESSVVPLEVVAAVCESAYAGTSGTELQPVDSQENIESYSVTVDIITETTKYSTPTGSKRPEVTAVKDALVRLIRFAKYGGTGIMRI